MDGLSRGSAGSNHPITTQPPSTTTTAIHGYFNNTYIQSWHSWAGLHRQAALDGRRRHIHVESHRPNRLKRQCDFTTLKPMRIDIGGLRSPCASMAASAAGCGFTWVASLAPHSYRATHAVTHCCVALSFRRLSFRLCSPVRSFASKIGARRACDNKAVLSWDSNSDWRSIGEPAYGCDGG